MKKNKSELKIVFDTNALFTGSASDLLNNDVIQLIEQNSSYPDVSIKWLLPEIVVGERRYQMISRGKDYLPSIIKLEKLLGHNLNINEHIVETRVDEVIKDHLTKYNIETIRLNTSDVKWNEMINKSINRLPPFEKGDTEKGFRDALIAECFLQLLNASPITPSICRVVLLTKDILLTECVSSQTKDFKNVKIIANLEDLKGLINTLVSEVDEKYVTKVLNIAKTYFFEKGKETSLFYKEKLRDEIEKLCESDLKSFPQGLDGRDNGTWYISSPNFVKKKSQKIHLSTIISVECNGYINKSESPSFLEQLGIGTGSVNLGGGSVTKSENTFKNSLLSTYLQGGTIVNTNPLANLISTKKEIIKKGTSEIEVIWSVLVSTRFKFSKAKIESIKYLETKWQNA